MPVTFTRTSAIYYAKSTMWNVEEKFTPKQMRKSLAALGFAVGSTRGVIRVEKYGSGAEFRKGTDDMYQMTVVPTIMLKGTVSLAFGMPATPEDFCSLTTA